MPAALDYLKLAASVAVGVGGVVHELQVDFDVQILLQLVLKKLTDEAVCVVGREQESDFRQPLAVGKSSVGKQLLGFNRVEVVLLAKLGIEAGLSGRDPAGAGNANPLEDALDETFPVDGSPECLS